MLETNTARERNSLQYFIEDSLKRIERLAVIHQVVRSQDVCDTVWVRSCCGSFFWQLFRSVAFYASRDKKIFLRGRGHGRYKGEWFYAIWKDIFLLQLSFHSIKFVIAPNLSIKKSFPFLWGEFDSFFCNLKRGSLNLRKQNLILWIVLIFFSRIRNLDLDQARQKCMKRWKDNLLTILYMINLTCLFFRVFKNDFFLSLGNEWYWR